MALSDDVQNRIPVERLKELTAGTAGAAAVDTTILGYAATDIQGDFELLSSEAYDNTNPVHLAIAVPAVMGKLYEYKGQISPLHNEQYDVFVAKCQRLQDGNIPGPETNSNYRKTQESTSDNVAFDRKHYRNYRPQRTFRGQDGDSYDND